MSLIDPIHTIEDAETKELVKFFNETLGFCPNSVLTMQKNPALAKAFINLNMAVMENHGSLTSEFKRLIAFISSNTTGCRYCQAHTIRAAERYGASKERLENIWNFEDSDCFSDQEKVALKFAREASKVPVATTKAMEEDLKQHWSENDIIEMMSVIALFGYLNRWNDVMGTSLEDDAIESANQYLKEKGWDIGKHH